MCTGLPSSTPERMYLGIVFEVYGRFNLAQKTFTSVKSDISCSGYKYQKILLSLSQGNGYWQEVLNRPGSGSIQHCRHIRLFVKHNITSVPLSATFHSCINIKHILQASGFFPPCLSPIIYSVLCVFRDNVILIQVHF